MSPKARVPRRRPREISERDYIPRWVKRLLIAVFVAFVLLVIVSTWPLWLPLFY